LLDQFFLLLERAAFHHFNVVGGHGGPFWSVLRGLKTAHADLANAGSCAAGWLHLVDEPGVKCHGGTPAWRLRDAGGFFDLHRALVGRAAQGAN
jgi:hypothetical protein